jgi:hypothetical protein
MESAGPAGNDALQPERLEGKVLQKLGQPSTQADEQAVLHGDWAMDALREHQGPDAPSAGKEHGGQAPC